MRAAVLREFGSPMEINLEGLVSERVPLETIDETVDHVRSGAVARFVIVFDQG